MVRKERKIKRIIALFMAVFVSINLFAYDFEVDGIYYNKTSDSTVSVTSEYSFSSSYSGDITIPSGVTYNEKSYSVTSIANNAFHYCIGLTSVTIPNSVTSIGNYAFQNCTGLTTLNYNADSCLVSYTWLYDCNNLETVIIGNNVKIIPSYFIYGKSKVTNIEIPNSVTSIGNYAFKNCTGLTSVTIPNSVTSIGSDAFSGCTGLTSVVIPNSISSIGIGAFSGCTGLTNVEIPNSVTSIGSYAFYGCKGLTSVVIPNSVKEISHSAFEYCSGLENVKIGNGITKIGYSAFEGCKYIDTLYCMAKFPPELKSSSYYDGGQAFVDVNKAITVYVPCGRTTMYQAANYWNEFTNIQEWCEDIDPLDSTLINKGKDTVYITDTITIHDTITLIDTVTIHDTIIPCAQVRTYIYAKIDEGTAYKDYGFDVTQAGTHVLTLQTADGCDSIITLYLQFTSSIEDIPETKIISIYPNPAKDVVVIEDVVCSTEHITINLYDTQGRLVLSETKPNATSYTLNTTSLKSGVYYINIGNITQKLIIQ